MVHHRRFDLGPGLGPWDRGLVIAFSVGVPRLSGTPQQSSSKSFDSLDHWNVYKTLLKLFKTHDFRDPTWSNHFQKDPDCWFLKQGIPMSPWVSTLQYTTLHLGRWLVGHQSHSEGFLYPVYGFPIWDEWPSTDQQKLYIHYQILLCNHIAMYVYLHRHRVI